jgi:guanylate kinase
VPPTIADLKERLMERSKREAFMEKRMAQMALDLPFINQTEYIVVNETGKLEMAVDDVASLVN